MRSALQAAAAGLSGLLHGSPGNLGQRTLVPAALAGLGCTHPHAHWHHGSQAAAGPAGVAGIGVTAAETSTAASAEEELGDLRPGMSLTEEEDDEAEHYRWGQAETGVQHVPVQGQPADAPASSIG
jgi:hypothetical protein